MTDLWNLCGWLTPDTGRAGENAKPAVRPHVPYQTQANCSRTALSLSENAAGSGVSGTARQRPPNRRKSSSDSFHGWFLSVSLTLVKSVAARTTQACVTTCSGSPVPVPCPTHAGPSIRREVKNCEYPADFCSPGKASRRRPLVWEAGAPLHGRPVLPVPSARLPACLPVCLSVCLFRQISSQTNCQTPRPPLVLLHGHSWCGIPIPYPVDHCRH